MAEMMVDDENGVQVLSEVDVDFDETFKAFQEQEPELAQMVRWSTSTRPSHEVRKGGLIDRDRYVLPGRHMDQVATAQHAVEHDDVVSGVVESTEALAFNRISIDTEDEDETDIWNQIGEHIDLDSRLREMWREDFSLNQFCVATWWGVKDFKVRGKSKDTGITRKKTYKKLIVPMGLSVLDPLKVVPVGNLMFGREQLAYCADKGEYDIIQAVIEGRAEDPLISKLMIGPYTPSDVERRLLSDDGVETARMFLMNPENVFRHTSTRPHYQRFAPIRMKSIFELLDLKRQLRAMDRAHLLGATNFLVVIKKGDKDRPAKQGEIQALQSKVRNLSQVPVIVGDHRLDIEIITPKNDQTLDPARYNGLDARITSRLYQMFMTGNFASGAKGDDSIKLAKMVAKGLESRRNQIRDTLHREVLWRCFDRNEELTEKPTLRFHPKRIALDFDPTFANFLLDLRDRGDLSRESALEEVDFDQYQEWRRRKVEDEHYDEVFHKGIINPWGGGDKPDTVSGPGSNSGAPGADPRKTGGRRKGGQRNGGGAAPGSGQGEEPADPSNKSDGRRKGDRTA